MGRPSSLYHLFGLNSEDLNWLTVYEPAPEISCEITQEQIDQMSAEEYSEFLAGCREFDL